MESSYGRELGRAELLDDRLKRSSLLKIGELLEVTIKRFNPDVDLAPSFVRYQVPYAKHMRILDVLNYLEEVQGQDIAYRWFCGVKKCGTCAVRVNGKEVLACWESAERTMLIEPLRHAPLIRDLAIDREDYEAHVLALKPWLQRKGAYPGFPERISHVDMKQASKALDCISCMACYSACPVLDFPGVSNFIGPAPLVQLAQVALDPRDGMDRAELIAKVGNIHDCVSCYKCEEVCPVNIPIVSSIIEPLKRRANADAGARSRHAIMFLKLISQLGRINPARLVLSTQGVRGLGQIKRALKLIALGKINLRQLIYPRAIKGQREVSKIVSKNWNKT